MNKISGRAGGRMGNIFQFSIWFSDWFWFWRKKWKFKVSMTFRRCRYFRAGMRKPADNWNRRVVNELLKLVFPLFQIELADAVIQIFISKFLDVLFSDGHSKTADSRTWILFISRMRVNFLFKMPPTSQKLVCIIFKYLHMLKKYVQSRPANLQRTETEIEHHKR